MKIWKIIIKHFQIQDLVREGLLFRLLGVPYSRFQFHKDNQTIQLKKARLFLKNTDELFICKMT